MQKIAKIEYFSITRTLLTNTVNFYTNNEIIRLKIVKTITNIIDPKDLFPNIYVDNL